MEEKRQMMLIYGRVVFIMIDMVAHDPLHPEQVRIFREMSPQRKWEICLSLLKTARDTRRAAIAMRHPEWSAEEVERGLARELAHART